MKNYQNRVLFAKKILPISAGELCKVIGENARLYDVDQDTMITCITFLDRYEPLCEGFLFLQFSEGFIHSPADCGRRSSGSY